jgi:hypothetical protein
MQETYISQSVIRYWKRYLIPVPDDFPIHPDYLFGCDRANLITGFRQLNATVGQIFDDMQQDPARYGLPLYEIEKFAMFTDPPGTLSQVIGAGSRPFFEAFHQRMVDRGYEARFDASYDWKVDYFKNNKYSYHFCQLEQEVFQLRLKLNNVRAYTDFLESCPERVQETFLQNPPCLRCREVCPMRVEYTFRGTHHESCICGVFQFHFPQVEEIDDYLKLMELEDEAKVNNKN